MKKSVLNLFICFLAVIMILLIISHYIALPDYRPFFYYDGHIYWDVCTVDFKPDESMEYLGTINFVTSIHKIPDENFETNSVDFDNGEIYKDSNGLFYLYLKNGKLLQLAHN